MLKQALEKPNKPPLILEKGRHGYSKLGMPYTTWSCKEPPTRIRKRSKAEILQTKTQNEEHNHMANSSDR